MADYLTNTTELTAVADAIREKTGDEGDLIFPNGFVSAIEGISGGGNVYRIDMTLSGTTVSNVNYNGSSATEIATAFTNDPTTRLVVVINASSDNGLLYCTPSMVQAEAYPDYGESATSIYLTIPLWYTSGGDRETYLLQLNYHYETWYAYVRTTI